MHAHFVNCELGPQRFQVALGRPFAKRRRSRKRGARVSALRVTIAPPREVTLSLGEGCNEGCSRLSVWLWPCRHRSTLLLLRTYAFRFVVHSFRSQCCGRKAARAAPAGTLGRVGLF